ncbi:MAG: uridine monophosphate synthetase [Candidatus Doudnabacteria bacterium Gr01-1014_77]|uniref:Uridine monophosphate synthetase n=1 Tax=Candidatus Doudnabacteria bacterium Gr01-1014_77 TaxID=2017133 RepID=A0A554JEF8_9BACT|nr:MAG: uridine monophosphate synthetase [Candidatus Doudnabacteria bacterium Gr01-1014_77]
MIVNEGGWQNEATTSFLDALWAIGAIMSADKSPGGKGFRLKLHERTPDAPLSPFYFNLRRLQSHTEVMYTASEMMKERVVENVGSSAFQLIAGIPTAGTPFSMALSLLMPRGHVSPRMEPKGHGVSDLVDGDFHAGQIVLLVDDLITEADSKLRAIDILQRAELVVQDIVVLIDREQGGKQRLEADGYRVHPVFTVTEVFSYYLKAGECTQAAYDRIMEYLFEESQKHAK